MSWQTVCRLARSYGNYCSLLRSRAFCRDRPTGQFPAAGETRLSHPRGYRHGRRPLRVSLDRAGRATRCPCHGRLTHKDSAPGRALRFPGAACAASGRSGRWRAGFASKWPGVRALSCCPGCGVDSRRVSSPSHRRNRDRWYSRRCRRDVCHGPGYRRCP